MIKILFVIHDLSMGGAEKVLVNLVNNMDKSKFDITVMAIFGGGINERFLSKDIRLLRCHSKMIPGNSKIMKLWTPQRLYSYYIREHYDIIVSYLEGPSARIVSGCTDLDTKLVTWIHGEQHTARRASASFRNYNEALKCYQRFDRTICVSDCVRRDFTNIYQLKNPVDVLFNTNETNQIIEKSKEMITEVKFYDNEIKLVGVGKVIPLKGFDRLARIHKRLRNEGFPVHTYILGVGKQQETIEKYLKENQVENSFTFLGYQVNPYKYVARCDLFVCTSLYEGFSTATTEALIVGTPVCTVEVSGMKEMLGENEYGIITKNDEEELYKAIKELINNPDLLKHYAEQAKKRGKDFSTQQTVNAVEEMLLNL